MASFHLLDPPPPPGLKPFKCIWERGSWHNLKVGGSLGKLDAGKWVEVEIELKDTGMGLMNLGKKRYKV